MYCTLRTLTVGQRITPLDARQTVIGENALAYSLEATPRGLTVSPIIHLRLPEALAACWLLFCCLYFVAVSLLTHSLTHSLTPHSLIIYSRTHFLLVLCSFLTPFALPLLLPHSLTHLLSHSLPHSFTPTLPPSLTHSLTHPLTHPLTHSPTHSPCPTSPPFPPSPLLTRKPPKTLNKNPKTTPKVHLFGPKTLFPKALPARMQ